MRYSKEIHGIKAREKLLKGAKRVFKLNCLECNKEIVVKLSRIKSGRGKFCSISCRARFNFKGIKNPRWKGGYIFKKCIKCGKSFKVVRLKDRKDRNIYCSLKCKGFGFNVEGKNNPQWKGGKHKTIQGYMKVRVGVDKYELEHRVVMAEKIGRKIKKNEVVHHINGNKLDNRAENLMIFNNQSEHAIFEGFGYE